MVVKEIGSVLVMILWVLSAMGLLALSFSKSIRTEVDVARNVMEQKQSYYLSRAGIEYAIYKILDSQNSFTQAQNYQNEDLKLVPNISMDTVNLSMSNGIARVEIVDESGKLNLNMAPEHLIFNLLIMVGLGEIQANIITDSIEDWRDQDDVLQPNGAENYYYQSLPNPYLPKNGLFGVPEELLLVRSISPEIYYGRKAMTERGERMEWYGLQKYFTTFTSANRINVNSAPLAVLAAIPGINYQTAVRIRTMVQDLPVVRLSQIIERIPGIPTESTSYLSTVPSNFYTLVSDGQLRNSSSINRIRSVVRVDGTSKTGYTLLYWNESNLEM